MPNDETLAKLQERVGNGMQWLSDHDPTGTFYAWFQVGLTPRSRIPKWEHGDVDEAQLRQEWTDWFKAKQTYDGLERRLAALEERAPNQGLPWALPWVPASAVRR